MTDRDNVPKTEPKGRGDRLFDRECEGCGHPGLEQREVPKPGGPKQVLVCPECGTPHDRRPARADKR